MQKEKGSSPKRTLGQTLAVGLVFAVAGVVMFMLIFSALNQVDQATRLFTAFCTPPVVIGIFAGLYALYMRNKSEN
ncbi:MAG: hypothetical protein KC546_21050 [Anaerolineae bacterium]|nr:hypothetical protein [Anaerolineae bacterium]MCA9890885.1 hypothetical protein [Anaerolineae bacterium]MCB9459353.1 hypothetical protein [Anaerolineaceae bacterium]